ncbi:transporter [Oceaniferula spumae]|uniref:Transporter n=1 Tax=Oceaniferula spumae TaxID=2979115 RepID=A0AAT9FSU2_9BACT
MIRFALILFAGLLFGLGLAISGMTDPARVIGFLDVAGNWDPSLIFVMGGALTTYAACMFITRKARHGKGLFNTDLPCAESEPISRRLILGSAAFGIGWALSGFCPGPALASLAAMRTEALVFVPTMLIGMSIAHYGFGTDK